MLRVSAIDDDFRSTAETPPSRRQRWMHSKAALLSAGALIVALVVGLALSLSALANQNALASSRSSALSAARTYTVELASYNYRDLDRDFSTVAANSTPSFRRTFAESSDALKSTLSRYKATAAAKVVSAGVVSASTSRAVVLVFLDQNIANSTQTKPTHRPEPGRNYPGQIGWTLARRPGHPALTGPHRVRLELGCLVGGGCGYRSARFTEDRTEPARSAPGKTRGSDHASQAECSPVITRSLFIGGVRDGADDDGECGRSWSLPQSGPAGAKTKPPKGLPPSLAEFANCPVGVPGVATCLYSSTTSTTFEIGSTTITSSAPTTLSLGLSYTKSDQPVAVLPTTGPRPFSRRPFPFLVV